MPTPRGPHALTPDEPIPLLHEPCFDACLYCGQTVLVRTWMGKGKGQRFVEEDPPRSPLLGLEHSVAQGTCKPTQGAQP
jgi:hypothetical protein